MAVKKDKSTVRPGPTQDKEDKEKQPGIGSHDNSAVYKQDKETGKWEVRNPSGSFVYNYLYRDEMDW